MTRVISVRCSNKVHCGYLNTFREDDLVGEVPLVGKNGERVPPPPVKIDANTFVKCENCGYPISCADASIDFLDEDEE